MVSRREKIEAMLADQPQDVTLRYMLAMELQKEGDSQRCLHLFDELMQNQPPYVPAFMMAGQHLTSLGRRDDARTVFQRGIVVARELNDEHAAAEMSQFLQELP